MSRFGLGRMALRQRHPLAIPDHMSTMGSTPFRAFTIWTAFSGSIAASCAASFEDGPCAAADRAAKQTHKRRRSITNLAWETLVARTLHPTTEVSKPTAFSVPDSEQADYLALSA